MAVQCWIVLKEVKGSLVRNWLHPNSSLCPSVSQARRLCDS